MAEYASTGRIQGNLIIAEICEMYGWTYWEYLDQPVWFIETIIEKLKIRNKREEANNKQSSRK